MITNYYFGFAKINFKFKILAPPGGLWTVHLQLHVYYAWCCLIYGQHSNTFKFDICQGQFLGYNSFCPIFSKINEISHDSGTPRWPPVKILPRAQQATNLQHPRSRQSNIYRFFVVMFASFWVSDWAHVRSVLRKMRNIVAPDVRWRRVHCSVIKFINWRLSVMGLGIELSLFQLINSRISICLVIIDCWRRFLGLWKRRRKAGLVWHIIWIRWVVLTWLKQFFIWFFRGGYVCNKRL